MNLIAVRFIGGIAGDRSLDRHEMEHPGGALRRGARPAGAQNRVVLRQDFGLHEKISEGRMGGVGGGCGDDHFGVTGDLDGA